MLNFLTLVNMKTFTFRLYPNANQLRELERTLETHRRLYNQVLDGRQLCWETAGVNWNYFEQSAWFTKAKVGHKYYSQINAASAQDTIKRADLAFAAFFRRCKRGEKPGYPRFKGVDQFSSFELRNGFKANGNRLRLQFIGDIRVRFHRELEGKTKRVRILRDNGKWFVQFICETPKPEPTRLTESIGLDVGLKSFVTTSTGEQLGDSKHMAKHQKELRRRQRALSRCRKGSNRRKKVKKRVTALHAKVRKARKDVHHKVSRSLVNRYGFIAVESLSIRNMLKNRRLARSISDAGWGQFVQILTSKAESAGCQVVKVNPKNTSQECSACGQIVQKDLSVRVHECSCGIVLDRDHNAAINILARAEPEFAKRDVSCV